MLRVSIVQAVPGMTLAAPVMLPGKADRMLLRAGFDLDAAAVKRLRDLKIREVWIRYPNLEFVSAYISPEIARAQAALTEAVGEALEHLSHKADGDLEYREFKSSLRVLIEKLSDDPKAAIFIGEMAGADPPMLRHAVNVCFISVLMGLKLRDRIIAERSRVPLNVATDLTSLGMGAMLHDVGALRLDPEVVERYERTGDTSDPAWREHAREGYEMVTGKVDPTAASVVLHHHQRFDGGGFPETKTSSDGDVRPLKGDEIHIFARIVACANVFDRLRRPVNAEEGAPETPVVAALKAMQAPAEARGLDPDVYAALLAVVPPYCPGTLVELSSGEQGVVVGWSAEDPCRPEVQVVGDLAHPTAADADLPRIDLRIARNVEIVGVGGVDVAEHNFYPEPDGRFAFGSTTFTPRGVRAA